jgi:hypothetical protein
MAEPLLGDGRGKAPMLGQGAFPRWWRRCWATDGADLLRGGYSGEAVGSVAVRDLRRTCVEGAGEGLATGSRWDRGATRIYYSGRRGVGTRGSGDGIEDAVSGEEGAPRPREWRRKGHRAISGP